MVVLGSLLDLAIISPLLVLAINKKKGSFVKRFIILMAGGLILAKFLIPMKYFEPFIWISYIGFGVEGLLILVELSLLFMLVRYMPDIIQKVRNSDETLLFSFPAVREKVRSHPIVKVFSSELLIFYYAFASWRKSPPKGKGFFTLHTKSSLLAFHIMLIHAIVIETLGLHWWLHDKSIVLSIVLLILNIYSIIFFLGEIQAVRLNPVNLTDNRLYLSLGSAKKMVVSLDDIAAVTTDQQVLEQKINSKTTIDFIARDFEEVHPHMILELKKPCRATLILGIEKSFTKVAIRLDDPIKFHQELKKRINM
ncbi:beta-carotene 15,15'-monooxygenase [Bacillus sp. DTU_2020_1000418_1_SI_GHA_SEK_038]|uniref:beta-carotene 15,15'-monooxygenase n=1 Tax=Bacillus sp. DTU_2020_1000418_1_SI_GHA_SEK_038 TaxID=3077585 RepID=UPI0028EE413B|nr:beta-carotene 15,15'-monooxygenase [Bacillus sp. DTU_2020_1000418_1_SI_GHA_SEK_038]WNS76078.1 beta-carotene 15,15'-monooxygenase [Bacillus sp. DTU_2020_1000418_1_SI_GHA_SEK_038]